MGDLREGGGAYVSGQRPRDFPRNSGQLDRLDPADEKSSTLLVVRTLGIDIGATRIGLALSDASGVLATPWRAIRAGASAKDSAAVVASLLATERERDESVAEIEAIVVGFPRRLSGEETELSSLARGFAAELSTLTGLSIHLQDERLTSREAESRLAIRERDWRARKRKLDAAGGGDHSPGLSRCAAPYLIMDCETVRL